MEKLGENLYKFHFKSVAEKDRVYNKKPWNMDGSLIILKEWPSNITIQDTLFDTTNFFFQVHGLPPNVLNQLNARKIGAQLGELRL